MPSPADIVRNDEISLRQQLYYYALGHTLIAGLIIALVFTPLSNVIGAPLYPSLAQTIAVIYMVIALSLLIWNRSETRMIPIITFSALIDIAVAILMIHALPSVSAGIAMMLLFNIASAAMLLPFRRSIIVTLLASISLIFEYYLSLLGGSTSKSLTELSMFVLSYLALAWLAYLGGRNTRKSQAIAQQKSAEIANLMEVSEMIIRRMRTGVLVVDADNRVSLANEVALSWLGPDDAGGKPLNLNRIAPELVQRLQRWRNGVSIDEDDPLRLAPDQPEVIPRFVRLLIDNTMTLIFLDDPTVVSKRAESLTLAALGRFSASLAHEIRNPLAAISYACQLLEESENLDAADRRLLQIIHQQCQRTNGIIESVLGMARRERANPESIDLNSFASRFVEEYRQTLAIETDSIEVTIADRPLRALVDPGHLQQILSTLVHNALKYGRMMDEPARIRLRVIQGEHNPMIDVVDRGPGIPDSIATQLFRPFFTTSEYGTGLGLYIARELCRANQASLEYLRIPGGGACFRITLSGPHNLFPEQAAPATPRSKA